MIRRPHPLIKWWDYIGRAKYARAPAFRVAIHFVHNRENILSQHHPMTRTAKLRYRSDITPS